MSLKIVFDFDGTLADTHHMVISAVNQIVNRETGREYTRKEIEAKFIANSEDLYPQFGIDMQAPGVRARLEDHWQELAQENWKEITFFDGVEKLLNDLKSSKHELYILTLRDRESTLRVLDRFNLTHYFEKIGCGDDEIQKPHAAALMNLIDDFSVQDANRVVMVGDSPVDIALARNAQVPSIHVKWCHFAKNVQLNQLNPTYTASHPLDCLPLIEEHLGQC